MAPKYVLTYFDSKGRAEVTRIMFAAAGVEYTDIRLSFEEWGAQKADTRRFPYGQLPVLQIDDKVVGQSKAISRFIARELGFYGNNSQEALDIDVITELCDDLVNPLSAIMFAKIDEETKKERLQAYLAETVTKYLRFLETHLKSNNGGNGFFVGDKISVADILFMAVMDWIVPQAPTVLDANPELKALRERVMSIEKIKDWIKRRPQTPH